MSRSGSVTTLVFHFLLLGSVPAAIPNYHRCFYPLLGVRMLHISESLGEEILIQLL